MSEPKKSGPYSLALVSNPKAGRNRRSLAGIQRELQHYPACRHFLASTQDEMVTVADQLAENPPDVVAINGGDGSVSLLLTLIQQRDWAVMPAIALLAGGTTNMTAAELGIAGKPDQALHKLLNWCGHPSQKDTLQRPLLKLQADTGDAHYGFFMGLGIIAQGVKLSLEKRAVARCPEWVPPMLTLRLLLGWLAGKRPLGEPIDIVVNTDHGFYGRTAYETLYASSLNRLLLGIRPHREELAATEIHWGAVEQNLPALWRTLPAFLQGREHPLVNPGHGFHRGATRQLMLYYQGDYMVDGELFEAASRLTISVTNPMTFVTC